MKEDNGMKLKVTAKRRILKFAEGANPEVDEPIGIEEKEIELTGEDARQVLNDVGINKEAAMELARKRKEGMNANGTN